MRGGLADWQFEHETESGGSRWDVHVYTLKGRQVGILRLKKMNVSVGNGV